MISIQILRNCYLCGEETSLPGNICHSCRGKCARIGNSSCAVCGQPIISELQTCLRCRERKYAFDRNRSLFEYTGTARDVFYQYKFERFRSIATWYAHLMLPLVEEQYQKFVIVPSPSESSKKMRRGWDQVEEICRHLNVLVGNEVVNALKKKKGVAQKKLDLEERKMNLQGRIVPGRRIGRIFGKNILLIDDIFTTGATAHECASVLKSNGALRVESLTVAID